LFLLKPLATCGKSNAIRAGLFNVKPAGGFAIGFAVLMRTLTLPSGNEEKSTASILLASVD